MAKKYVAAIMNRLTLEDGNFIYYISHPAIGEIDEKTKIFRDKNGREYLSMLDSSLQMSEIPTAYYYPIALDEVKNQMKSGSVQEAISDYDYSFINNIYYVSSTEDSGVFCVPINLGEMKDKIAKCMEAYNNRKDNNNKPSSAPKVTPQVGESQDEFDNEEESFGDKLLSSKEVRTDIAALLMNMIDGVYSLEELKEIRTAVKMQLEDIESLADSIDLQIEASENGESSTKLKGESASTPVKRETIIERKPTVKIKNHLDLEDLFKKVTATLIAQDEPTRRVLTEIARKEQSSESKQRGLLITGQSGSGKTKMMQLIAKYIDRPFYKVDSTQLTVPGYVGKDIEEVLWDLYVACGKDKDKAEHAIIYFDEIDKKGSSKKDDVSGKGVLNVLLPFIEGSEYDATPDTKLKGETVKINTGNMIVILGGAYTDVYKNLKVKTEIGFGSQIGGNATREATTDDFVEKAKMPDEFMGRVSVIKLNDLDLEAIKKILTDSDESAIKIQKRLFEELGVKLTFGDDYIEAIAKKAEKRKTGARGLNTVVDETTWEAYGDAYSHLGEYEEIILGEETVEDPKQYKKVYRS